MVKRVISDQTMLRLKVNRLESIIESLKREIPLEGKLWQRGMIEHYTRKLNELIEGQHGNRRS